MYFLGVSLDIHLEAMYATGQYAMRYKYVI
jgi:hypothetical protein